MAIPNFDTYRFKRTYPWQRIRSTKGAASQQAARATFVSKWTEPPFAGAAPTTAVVPTRATAGALGQQNSSGTLRLLKTVSDIGTTISNASQGFVNTLVIADRLSHQGGLSGTSVAAQTTNLPTAALTRYTSGAGVMAMLEIYTVLGATLTTVTCSYTNQAGTAGRTSIATPFGGTCTADECFAIPLQSGDSGVRAVASVTLAASTLAVGNFGVTLYRPLWAIPLYLDNSSTSEAKPLGVDALLDMGANVVQVQTDACLFFLGPINSPPNAATVSNSGSGFTIIEYLMAED